MHVARRIVRLVWGAEVEPALRPVLAVTFAGSIAGSSGWTFMGIWAIDELGADKGDLGIAFLAGAVLAAVSGYVGGYLSDRLGRRPIILAGWGGFGLFWLGFLAAGATVTSGLIYLACAGILGALGGSVTQAMVADLVPPERHEQAYASVRVIQNLGVVMGPPVGSLFLLLGSWNALFVGVATLSTISFALAWRFLPRGGAYAPEGPPERGSFALIRKDTAFLVFLGSSMLAWLVYVAYEVVLPVSLTDVHGYSAAQWGLLVIINPLMVTLLQMRLTRRFSGVPPWLKLAVAMPLMGLPFLFLSISAAAPVVAVMIVLFVIGEMLWVPTSQSVVAGLAPPDVRGAYMGAFGSGAAVGFALAPFVGLQIGDRWGDSATWLFFAVASVVAGVLGALAARGVRTQPESEGLEPEPNAEPALT